MCKERTNYACDPSPLNKFFVVEITNWPEGFHFTKDHSAVYSYAGRTCGISTDYREREEAQSAANRLNIKWAEEDEKRYVVKEV